MLAIARRHMPGAGSALAAAGVISVTIAIGIATGLGVGRNVLSVSRWLSRRPRKLAAVFRHPDRSQTEGEMVEVRRGPTR